MDHLDIMSHFVIDGHDSLDRTAAKSLGVGVTGRIHVLSSYLLTYEPDEQEMLTCCWVRVKGDAVLAAGGTGGVIHILSLAFSTETKQLLGHTGVFTLEILRRTGQILTSTSHDRPNCGLAGPSAGR